MLSQQHYNIFKISTASEIQLIIFERLSFVVYLYHFR
jgi:hypothetical protein